MLYKHIGISNMKRLKLLAAVLLAISSITYFSFLFIIPNIINPNNYKQELITKINDATRLSLSYDKSEIITSPNLTVGIKLHNMEFKYQNGENLFKCDNFSAKISILPLLIKKIQISNIESESPHLFLSLTEENKLGIIEDFNSKPNDNTHATIIPFEFSQKLPKIKLYDYKVNITDKNKTDNLQISGDSFTLSNSELNKKAHIKTTGNTFLNGRKQIAYDLDIFSFLNDFSKSNTYVKTFKTNVNPIEALKRYDPNASISSKLKIKKHKNKLILKGNLDIINANIILNSKRTPDSYCKLNFDQEKIDVKSHFFFSDKENAEINGSIKNGRNQKVDISFSTTTLQLSTIQQALANVFECLGIQNELNHMKITGTLKGKFKLLSNTKKIISSGYFSIENAQILHTLMPLKILSISSYVDFSDNSISIKNTKALINGTELKALGNINNKAETNILIKTDKLKIAEIINAFAPQDIRNTYSAENGLISIDVKLLGTLSKIKPEIKLLLNDLNFKDKKNQITVFNKTTKINITTSKRYYKGLVEAINTGIKANNTDTKIINPNLKISFDRNRIDIFPAVILLNNSPINIFGSIGDYTKKAKINIEASGKINSADLAADIPKDQQQNFQYDGILPLSIKIKGDKKKTLLNAQILADSCNFISPVLIKKLIGKSSIIYFSGIISDNNLQFKNVGLYQLQSEKIKNIKFRNNLSSSNPLIQITGNIKNINKADSYIEKLNIQIPAALSMMPYTMKDSKLSLKGNINLSGYMSNPIVQGGLNISNVVFPELMTSIENIDLLVNDSKINSKIENLIINGSPLNIQADAVIFPDKTAIINQIEISSSYINLNNISQAMTKFFKQNQPHNMKNISINKGTAKIDKFKMGNVVVDSIKSNFTLKNNNMNLNIEDSKTCNGSIKGKIHYNTLNTQTQLNLTGEKLNANTAISNYFLLKDQLFGTLDFYTSLSFMGITQQEQMDSLKGTAEFKIINGQTGTLCKLENFMKADNIIFEPLLNTNNNATKDKLAMINLNEFKYLYGKVHFKGENAIIGKINSSGTNISLNITGNINTIKNKADLVILGRLSNKASNELGLITSINAENIISTVPKFGPSTLELFKNYTEKTNVSEINKIPKLTDKTGKTKPFKVIIQGNIDKSTSIRSFKWLNTETEIQQTENSILEIINPDINLSPESLLKQAVPSLNIAKSKEELYDKSQQNVKNKEKLVKAQQNEYVQNLQKFGNILKEYSAIQEKTSGNKGRNYD